MSARTVLSGLVATLLGVSLASLAYWELLRVPESNVIALLLSAALILAGTLVVAAAGNESSRHEGWYAPVGHPANCPSILAVGAVDEKMQLGDFSNRGLNPRGGQVDVVAPGVDVLSAFPMPARTRRLSGTSMATPHVAGLVALWAEANPKATATELWTLLTQHARRLPLLSTDVGAGLATAP